MLSLVIVVQEKYLGPACLCSTHYTPRSSLTSGGLEKGSLSIAMWLLQFLILCNSNYRGCNKAVKANGSGLILT